MTDYFALLGLPRQPVLEEDGLQENYLRLAAAWHPDAAGGDTERFRALQEGRKILSEPAARLRHLLDLEGFVSQGAGGHGSPELFLEVAGTLEAVKSIRSRMELARSAISRATIEPDRRRGEERVAKVSEQVALAWGKVLERLEIENALWPESNLSRLEEIRKELVFLTRWRKELRESLFCLQNPSTP